jgi:hypothetical protein
VTEQMMDDAELEAMLDQGDEEPERTGSGFRRETHFGLKEGEFAVLRFMQESRDWYKVMTHRFFPTRPAPSDFEGNWPESMSGTCRKMNEKMAKLFPQGCAICDSGYKNKWGKKVTPDDLRYTYAIEREEVDGDGTEDKGGPEMKGKRFYRDVMVDVPLLDAKGEETEETVRVPKVVIVSQTMFQMMSSLKANGEAYGTLRDRDYRIKRIKNPSGKGTIYQCTPLDKDPEILPGTEHWGFYEVAVQAYGLSLPRLILRLAQDDYWKRFFLMDDGMTAVDIRRGSAGVAPVPAQTQVAAGPPAPNSDALAAMRARIAQQ